MMDWQGGTAGKSTRYPAEFDLQDPHDKRRKLVHNSLLASIQAQWHICAHMDTLSCKCKTNAQHGKNKGLTAFEDCYFIGMVTLGEWNR